MSLEQFTENIKTECSMINHPILSIQAIKVDGVEENSLKNTLCNNSLKSCDYIKFTDNEICFIEFSDFYEQLNNLITENNHIKNSNISAENKRSLVRKKIIIKPQNVIKNEIQNKISETILLFDLICKNYPISKHQNKDKEFIICLCKIIPQHSILFDNILREIRKKFKYTICIDMFIYSELKAYLGDKIS